MADTAPILKRHIGPRRIRQILFGTAITALMIATWLWLMRGMEPYSLWLDDQWVASLVLHASHLELFRLRPPAPLGFIALLKLSTFVLGWGHWQLQLIPVVFAIVQLPIIGWIAWRATSRLSLGIASAILLSGSRLLGANSLRVKQYSLEGFIGLAIIAAALHFYLRPSRGRLIALAAVALAALPFSFTAVPIGLLAVNLVVLRSIVTNAAAGSIRRGTVVRWAALYNFIVVLWVCYLQFGQANDMMFEYWRGYYLPLHDLSALWKFTKYNIAAFVAEAFSPEYKWLAWGIPVAIGLMAMKRSTRWAAAAVLLFYIGMLAASALGLYPIGGRRTDVFSYPITVLTIIGGFGVLAARWSIIAPLLTIALTLHYVVYYPPGPVAYSVRGGRGAIEAIAADIQPEDLLIIAPQSSWVFGCYGSWPVSLERATDTTNGFIVNVHRPNTLLLRAAFSKNDAEYFALHTGLRHALEQRPPRIYYVSIHFWNQPESWVTLEIESHGYSGKVLHTRDNSWLMRFDLIAATPAP